MIRRVFRPGRVYEEEAKFCTKPPPVYKPLNPTRNFGIQIQSLKHKTISKSSSPMLIFHLRSDDINEFGNLSKKEALCPTLGIR